MAAVIHDNGLHPAAKHIANKLAHPNWDVRTISDTLYHAAAVDRLYCSGLIQPSDSFGLSSL